MKNSEEQDVEEPVLSIDNPNMSISEKLEKVRVQTLVKEYLAAQEMQLLGEGGMSDAIQTFVEKDDPHAIQSCVICGNFWLKGPFLIFIHQSLYHKVFLANA